MSQVEMPTVSEESSGASRAARVLELVSRSGWTLAALARELGTSRRAAGRIVSSLDRVGMLSRDSKGLLVPGAALHALARRVGRQNDLSALARGVVDELVDVTQCTVLLHLLHGDELLPEVTGVPADAVAISFPAGRAIPIWQGVGRAVLAYLDPTEVEAIARQAGVRNLPQLAAMVEPGTVVVSHGEVVPGIAGVGAAVLDGGGRPVGVLAVVSLEADSPERFGPVVLGAAQRLSTLLAAAH